MQNPRRIPSSRFAAALLLAVAGTATAASGEETRPVPQAGAMITLPGTSIHLSSSEQQGRLGAEVSATLPYPFATVSRALSVAENWCQFMPLHFNIKACTYQSDDSQPRITLYSGRKHYQPPEQGHPLTYRFVIEDDDPGGLTLQLHAANGPAGTRDYRIRLHAIPQGEGTQLQVHSSYRPSMLSSLLTRGYLTTLGRDKVGFSRLPGAGEQPLVQGLRGVIERNVMRYHLAIDAFLATLAQPGAARPEAARRVWFGLNEQYPLQLHEMGEGEYLANKQREWREQQRLQRSLDAVGTLAAMR